MAPEQHFLCLLFLDKIRIRVKLKEYMIITCKLRHTWDFFATSGTWIISFQMKVLASLLREGWSTCMNNIHSRTIVYVKLFRAWVFRFCNKITWMSCDMVCGFWVHILAWIRNNIRYWKKSLCESRILRLWRLIRRKLRSWMRSVSTRKRSLRA